VDTAHVLQSRAGGGRSVGDHRRELGG
jgi:hypothetical protein